MKIRKVIKNFDIFGYKVNINFDKKSEVHRTIVGGIISILLGIFYIIYFGLLLNKMITHGEDNDTILQSAINIS